MDISKISQESASRRRFIHRTLGAVAAAAAWESAAPVAAAPKVGGLGKPGKSAKAAPFPLPFKISLAQWSLNKELKGGAIDHLDFAKIANGFGLDGIEYVNQFFMDKAKDNKYLAEMKKRAAGEGVWSVLIMIDREGALGDTEAAKRKIAVENHHKWVDAAAYLGCHAIRVNAHSSGGFDEQLKLAADGLRKLSEYADGRGINVIVENHGGLSSNGAWLAGVMKAVGHPRCGTLPDFGNFRISETEEYDRYRGVEELMPYAKSVSAKTFAFDKRGNETTIDYLRMMKIVAAAGYRGYVGIEYEGDTLPAMEGIAATKKLLEKTRATLARG